MKNILLNSPKYKEILSLNKITILDGGARGDVFAPFNQVDKNILQIVRFEPDPNASIVKSENEVIVPMGIWNKNEKLKLNIGVAEATSSVYPFDIKLQQYIDPLIDKRKTKKTVEINCISIDEFISQNIISEFDFIKLDIHASEFEALEGARNTIKSTLGLLVESWTIPIHKGQKIRAEVESLIYKYNFFLFEEYVHSRWARYDKNHSKKQPVTVDSLYFIDPLINDEDITSTQAIKLIGIADLFGHLGYAIQLADFFYSKKKIESDLYEFTSKYLMRKIKENYWKRLSTKLLAKVNRLLSNCTFK